jgi:pimeloyl-ACP methyl ester carboxylesterase
MNSHFRLRKSNRVLGLTLGLMIVALGGFPEQAGARHFGNVSSADAVSRFATLDGSRVHYETRGSGREALVFVHGWCCNLDFWSGQTPAFEAKTRVIAIDLPGHGKSDKPQVVYTMDLFARAVDAVLSDAGVDRAVLVGHSMGTPVMRQFYRKFPAKTLGLVVVDGPLLAFADAEAMKKFVEPLRGPNYKEAARTFIDGMLGPEVSAAMREQIKSSMTSTPQHVAVSAMDAMAAKDIWNQDQIAVPVLAVMAKSPFWPADIEQSYRRIAPKLDYHTMLGVSHFLMMEKPKEFNSLLESFLMKNGLLKK